MKSPINIANLISGLWRDTSQPLKERHGLLPLGIYEDGEARLAVPGFVQTGLDGITGFGKYGYDTDEANAYNAGKAFDAAGFAMTGGLGVGLAGGLADNAVGSAGARLRLKDGRTVTVEGGPKRYEFKDGDKNIGEAYTKDAGAFANVAHVMLQPEYQGSGFGRQFYDLVEADLGKELRPSKRISDEAMRMWQSRRPDLVANYEPDPDGGFMSLYANSPTGSSVPLLQNALERAQPQGIREDIDLTALLAQILRGRP